MSRLILVFIAVAPVLANAVAVPAALTRLAGCYEVTYRYLESGRPEYLEHGVEYIDLKTEGDTIVMQHYGASAVPTIHWGQRWTQSPGGNWTLTVTSPSGEPRYSCTGPLTESLIAGASGMEYYRTCVSPAAPKPRRDRNRTDYDVLDREHTWRISDAGFSDIQYNLKKKTDGTLIAHELGRNEYKRLTGEAAHACDAAVAESRGN